VVVTTLDVLFCILLLFAQSWNGYVRTIMMHFCLFFRLPTPLFTPYPPPPPPPLPPFEGGSNNKCIYREKSPLSQPRNYTFFHPGRGYTVSIPPPPPPILPPFSRAFAILHCYCGINFILCIDAWNKIYERVYNFKTSLYS